MLRHVLLLRPRASIVPAEVEDCRQSLAALVGKVPGLLDFHWGENVAPADRRDGYTHGFSMDFADRASLEGYGPHPDHRVAAAKVRAAFEHIVVFDFELDAAGG